MEAVVSARGSQEGKADITNEDGQAARHVGIAYDSVMACPTAGEAVPGASRAR